MGSFTTQSSNSSLVLQHLWELTDEKFVIQGWIILKCRKCVYKVYMVSLVCMLQFFIILYIIAAAAAPVQHCSASI